MLAGAARIALELSQLSLQVPYRLSNSGMEKPFGNRMPSLAISWLALGCLFVGSRYAARSELARQGVGWIQSKLHFRREFLFFYCLT